jgi:hypothetical protein
MVVPWLWWGWWHCCDVNATAVMMVITVLLQPSYAVVLAAMMVMLLLKAGVWIIIGCWSSMNLIASTCAITMLPLLSNLWTQSRNQQKRPKHTKGLLTLCLGHLKENLIPGMRVSFRVLRALSWLCNVAEGNLWGVTFQCWEEILFSDAMAWAAKWFNRRKDII